MKQIKRHALTALMGFALLAGVAQPALADRDSDLRECAYPPRSRAAEDECIKSINALYNGPAVQVGAAAVVDPGTTTTTLKKTEVLGTQVVAAPAVAKEEVLGVTVERAPAFTGANSVPLAVAGLSLTGLGGMLLVGARRRKGSPARR